MAQITKERKLLDFCKCHLLLSFILIKGQHPVKLTTEPLTVNARGVRKREEEKNHNKES